MPWFSSPVFCFACPVIHFVFVGSSVFLLFCCPVVISQHSSSVFLVCSSLQLRIVFPPFCLFWSCLDFTALCSVKFAFCWTFLAFCLCLGPYILNSHNTYPAEPGCVWCGWDALWQESWVHCPVPPPAHHDQTPAHNRHTLFTQNHLLHLHHWIQ